MTTSNRPPLAEGAIIAFSVDPAALAIVSAVLHLRMPLGLRGIITRLGELTEEDMDRAASSLIDCGGVRKRDGGGIELDALLALMLHQAAMAERVYSLSLAQGAKREERLLYLGDDLLVVQAPTDGGQIKLTAYRDHRGALLRMLDGTRLFKLPAGTGVAFSLTAADLREAQIASIDERDASDTLEMCGVPRDEARAVAGALCDAPTQGQLVVYNRMEGSDSAFTAAALLTWLASAKGVWCSPDHIASPRLTLEPISGPALYARLAEITAPHSSRSAQEEASDGKA